MPTDNKILKLVLDTVLGLKTDVTEIKTDVTDLKTAVTELKTDVTEIKTRLSNVEKVQTEHGHHLTSLDSDSR